MPRRPLAPPPPSLLGGLLLVIALCGPAWAAPSLAPLVSGELGRLKTHLGYQVEHSTDQKVDGQSADLGYSQHDLNLS
ncbi:MAG: hypothetical protein V1806_12380, partial [Pseudomonadota bacterium]